MRGLGLTIVMMLAGRASGEEFAPRLPVGVSDVSGWENVRGSFATAHLSGSYRFYVNPRFPALFQVMRYRVRFGASAGGLDRDYRSAERVVWHEYPGRREPLRCFERTVPPSAEQEWREMTPGTPEYIREMGVVIRVLGMYRHHAHGELPR